MGCTKHPQMAQMFFRPWPAATWVKQSLVANISVSHKPVEHVNVLYGVWSMWDFDLISWLCLKIMWKILYFEWSPPWHLFWHSFQHSIWHLFWHSFWHSIWHMFWHRSLYGIDSNILCLGPGVVHCVRGCPGIASCKKELAIYYMGSARSWQRHAKT